MTTTIQVRGVDAELWRDARAKAIKDRLSTKQLLERLLRDWVKEKTTK
jgi:hypothetical protein